MELDLGDVAHSQIAEYLKIPLPYYNRMRAEEPELLADNVNRWLEKLDSSKPEGQRLVRTLRGRARAVLSNTYQPRDNAEMLEAIIPPLIKHGVDLVSASVGEKNLYLKVVDSRIRRDLPLPLGQGHSHFDTVSPALVLRNSEVGYGALAIQASIWTAGCTNLAIIQEMSVRKFHVGRREELAGESYRELLTNETKMLRDRAYWAEVRDVALGAFQMSVFEAEVQKLAGAAATPITGKIDRVIEVTQAKFSLTGDEASSILDHLVRSGNLSKYGLHAAVTRASQDLDSYERASEFEKLGGDIIDLPDSEWRVIAEAA
jgi:hypothetical protein